MKFRVVADLPFAGRVYAEGWQTWSKVALYTPDDTTTPAKDAREQTVLFRPGKPVPEGVIQAEGLLAAMAPGEPARAWFAPDPATEVPTLRLRQRHDRWELSADGEVEQVSADTLEGTLEGVGDRLGIARVRSVPPGWSSWSYYFKHVTEQDVLENVEAARRLELPVEIVQLDDGYETEIGDWLEVRPEFGSLESLAHAVRERGMQVGIWVPPFSGLFAMLVGDHDALLPDEEITESLLSCGNDTLDHRASGLACRWLLDHFKDAYTGLEGRRE